MKRKHWIIIGASLVLLALLCVGALGAYLAHKQQQTQERLAKAEAHFEASEWSDAKSNFAWYLSDQPKDPQALRKYAQASMNLLENRPKMLRDAGSAYYQLILDDPNDKESIEKLRNIYTRINAWADVEYIASLTLLKDDPALKYYRAVALDRLNRRDEAITTYRKLIEEGTEYAEAYGDLAILLHSRDLVREADAVLSQAAETHPDDPYILIQQARYAFIQNDLSAVEEALRQAQASIPGDPKLLAMQARAAMARSDWTAAIELSETALAQTPEDSEIHFGLINIYAHLDRHEDAIAHLENLPELFRADFPAFQAFMVETLLKLERIDEAETELAQYAMLYPDNNIMHEYMEALTLLATGNATTAATKLTNTVETVPDFRQARLYLAIACLQSQQRNRAKTVLEKYRRDYPGDPASSELYQREFGQRQTMQQARSTAQSLLKNETATANELTAAARAILRQSATPSENDPATSEARQLLEKAIEAAPTEPTAYLALADLILSLKDPESATKLIERAAENGIDENSLWLPRACVSLLSGNPEAGLALFRAQLSSDAMTINEIIRVANNFVSKGTFSDGLAVLEEASSQLNAADRATIEIERIAMAARFGYIEETIEYLREMERRADLSPEIRTSLHARKESLIRTMIQPGPMNNPVMAKTLVEELRRSVPDNTDFRLLEARVLLEQPPPEFQAARNAVAPLMAEGVHNIHAIMTMADIALREGRVSTALSHAEKAAASAPEDTTVQILLAEIQFRMQRYNEATGTLEQALAVQPNDRRTMGLLVEAYRATGLLIQAETLLARLEQQTLDESDGPNEDIDTLRGRLLLAKGEQLEHVETIFRAQYEEDPTDFRVVTDLARVLQNLNRTDEVEQLLMEFAESQASRADAWVALAQFYRAKGDPEDTPKVSSAYTRALLADKNYPPALRGLVQLELDAKHPSKALGLCDRYLEHQPYDPPVLYLRATLLARRVATTEEAKATITKAIDIIERAEYLYLRSIINLNTKNYPEVLRDLNRITRIQGGATAGVEMGFAEAYWETDEIDLAKRHYLSAVSKVNKDNLVDKARLKRIGELINSESTGT